MTIDSFYGLLVGAATFLCIGIFHPLVIKAEYYLGVKSWWLFLLIGICGIIGSIFADNQTVSILLGVMAFSSLWGIGEVFKQRERVRKGWFPKNPKRKDY
ncbi:MAG: DUF4491 family protein [Paludibacteraceae bacterium]|nr:DUF4491 family protein [Paludibacteraceae bacterium]